MADLAVSISERAVLLGEHVIPARWLRDHGDDAASLHPDSKQRLTDTFAIDPNVTPLAVHVDGAWLDVDWDDGARTGHDLDRLLAIASARRSPVPRVGTGFSLPDGIELWDTPPTPQ
ncbi:MAG: gamma-butyrobetaine hydroxylase-like domain-containing protein, partial [Actinomycetota bacterium]